MPESPRCGLPVRRRADLLCILLMLAVPGCCTLGPAPRSAAEAIDRVNGNVSRIDEPIQASAILSSKFVDPNGVTRRFIGHPAAVVFRPPLDLLIEIRSSLGGTVSQIGSDNRRYWLWVDLPDNRTLWWGTWQALSQGRSRPLVVPPDQLLDAFCMRPLAQRLALGLAAELDVSGLRHRVRFADYAEDGRAYARREIVLDPCEPQLVKSFVELDETGAVLMRAELSDYKRVDRDGPWVARRYVIVWPQRGAELRLDLTDVTRRTLDAPFNTFPRRWRGDEAPLDDPEIAGTAPG